MYLAISFISDEQHKIKPELQLFMTDKLNATTTVTDYNTTTSCVHYLNLNENFLIINFPKYSNKI